MDLLKIDKNKDEFLELLRSTKRDGVEDLISWLVNKSDFFNAPSSTVYHGNFPGGLCQHSLNVYYAAKKFYKTYKDLALEERDVEEIREDEIIIAALLHDLCKANFYTQVEKWNKSNEGIWSKYFSYKIDDKFPLGHGEKSVFIAQTFMKLTGSEMLAIRWHMLNSDCGVYISNYQKPAMQLAVSKCPLVLLIAQSDYFASYFMERQVDQIKENLIY